MAANAPTVTQTLKLGSPAKVQHYLAQVRAQFRRHDEVTGRPLYKNGAGVVFRPTADGNGLEVLANCVC